MPFGFGAERSSFIATYAVPVTGKPCCCLISYPILVREGRLQPVGRIMGFVPTYFDSEERLPQALAALRERSPGGLLPGVYAVVNVERIEARMRLAEEESSKRRKALTRKSRRARSHD
jgi:hypothetical protein